jgi:hypothetical protein
MDHRIGPLLEIVLAPSSMAGERDNARGAVNRLLGIEGVTISDLMAAPRFNPDSTYGQWVAELRTQEKERTALVKQVAALKRQLLDALSTGIDANIRVWLAEGGTGDLPAPRRGHYPFIVLKTVCSNRLGSSRGWQAALSTAVFAETGKPFRQGQIEDWQRSHRKGVPAEIVRIANTSEHLRRPEPHKWTPEQRGFAERRIGENASDSDIASELLIQRVHVTSEAVRSIRKAMVRVSRAPVKEAA